MTVETKSSVARCVPIQPSGGGGDKNTGGQKNTNDGGSSNNAGAIAGGVVGGGILLLALTAAVVYFLWRRNKSNGGNAMMLSMMKQKKHKKAQDSDDDERSESRYTKSPVGTMRDPPSVGHEISEVDKLPEAPGIPQTSGNNEVYDAVKRQDSVAHVYKPMEFKTNTYQNSSAIDKAGDNNESIYNNTNTAPATATTVHHDEDEGPTETYENLGQDVPEDQGYYMDMSGGRAADAARTNQQEQDVAEETNEGFVQEDIYINDVDNQPPSRHAPAPPVTEDDVYLNDAPAPPLTQDDVYLNEEAVTAHPGQVDAQDELYLNQGELVEENIYQNT